jgi:hypothetical protein
MPLCNVLIHVPNQTLKYINEPGLICNLNLKVNSHKSKMLYIKENLRIANI